MKRVKIQKWEGCYDKQLKGFIVNEAFAHPAKYSLGLIERIFDYCLERGYLKRGDVVGDCFGGVAIGGLVAAYRGLRWVGVELEPKFVGLCQQNIALHKSKLEALGRPLPLISQGDSRKFHEHVQATGIVSSPPYADSVNSGESGIDWKKAGRPEREAESPTRHGVQGAAGHKMQYASGIVTSPPYADTPTSAGNVGNTLNNSWGKGKRLASAQEDYGNTTGQIGRLKAGEVEAVISSPPYNKPFSQEHPGTAGGERGQHGEKGAFVVYGATEGQIEGLKNSSVDACISSPPYSNISPEKSSTGINIEKQWQTYRAQGGGMSLEAFTAQQARHSESYGQTDGQISRLKGGSVEAVVSSPPWEKNTDGVMKASKFKNPAAFAEQARKAGHGASLKAKLKAMAEDENRDNYGDSPGQIGKEKGETYWQAMAQVYDSCYFAIKPGGVIVLVVKDYVKGGKRVPLCDDTCRLLEHLGFTVIERIHAMLVKETRHDDLFNGHTVQTKSRKSFFRRLAEKNGSPKIDFEEVLIARKPNL